MYLHNFNHHARYIGRFDAFAVGSEFRQINKLGTEKVVISKKNRIGSEKHNIDIV